MIDYLLCAGVVLSYFFGRSAGRQSMWEDYHNSDGTKRRAWFEKPDDPSWEEAARRARPRTDTGEE